MEPEYFIVRRIKERIGTSIYNTLKHFDWVDYNHIKSMRFNITEPLRIIRRGAYLNHIRRNRLTQEENWGTILLGGK